MRGFLLLIIFDNKVILQVNVRFSKKKVFRGWKGIYCGSAFECERGDDVGLGEAEVPSCACGQIRADAISASWETRDGGHSA